MITLHVPGRPAARAENETPMRLISLQIELRAFLAGALLASVGGVTWAALGSPTYHVSQKGRAFQPGEITIRRGQTVQIVNDDGDLLHHAYIDSELFTFDSGDQEPGSTTDVIFPVSGSFNVLCGIHPKMKLVVRVD